MIYILLSLGLTIITTLLLTYFLSKEGDEIATSNKPEVSDECCGAHEICETDLLILTSSEIEYYNDEELDRFKNYTETQYTASDIDEFRDVLLTLKESEVASWMKSIQLRQISMPYKIREEALLIISERRYNH